MRSGHLEIGWRALICGLTLAAVALTAQAQELKQIPGAGPADERAAVLETLLSYLRVTDEQSASSIPRAFHPVASLMSVTPAGGVATLSQDAWWERVSRPRTEPLRRISVVRLIDVEGQAAIARIDISTGRLTSTDFLTLLKTRDGWRIVNKILSIPLG